MKIENVGIKDSKLLSFPINLCSDQIRSHSPGMNVF